MSERVLVIEDNPANMELVRYILDKFGYQVDAAIDGESGVEMARASPPGLVICDLQLPGIDGFEVVRQLKAMPHMRQVPVLAVTAYAMVGDRERVLAAGFDGYISKPIDPQYFVQQVASVLGAATPSAAPPLGLSVATFGQRLPVVRAQALVLDDSIVNLDLLRSLLEPHGIQVQAATTIREAMALLDERTPDLIISDMHIGHELGQDFYTLVKHRPALAAVPFMFLTSTVPRELRELARGPHGADRFITRPIDNLSLLAEIESCLAGQPGR